MKRGKFITGEKPVNVWIPPAGAPSDTNRFFFFCHCLQISFNVWVKESGMITIGCIKRLTVTGQICIFKSQTTEVQKFSNSSEKNMLYLKGENCE